MADRRRSETAQARSATERPLPPHDRVVGKGGEREPRRPTAPSARGLHRSQGVPRAQCFEAEMPRPPDHPARVTPRCTETDPMRIECDSVRPLRQRRPQRCIAGVTEGGEGKRARGKAAQRRETHPPPWVQASAAAAYGRRLWRSREGRAGDASRRSSGLRPGRRCCRPDRRRPGRQPARWRPPDRPR